MDEVAERAEQDLCTRFWGPDLNQLRTTDLEIVGVILSDLERLRGGLQLIASEIRCKPKKRMVASGIRVGVFSVVTQGMGEAEMARFAALIPRAVWTDPVAAGGSDELAWVSAEVVELVAAFPTYPRG